MTIDDKIRVQKLQYELTEKRQKYQYCHLEKIDKNDYLAGEEILLSN